MFSRLLKDREDFSMGLVLQNAAAPTSAEAQECGSSWKKMFRFAEHEGIVTGNESYEERIRKAPEWLRELSRGETECGETC